MVALESEWFVAILSCGSFELVEQSGCLTGFPLRLLLHHHLLQLALLLLDHLEQIGGLLLGLLVQQFTHFLVLIRVFLMFSRTAPFPFFLFCYLILILSLWLFRASSLTRIAILYSLGFLPN